MQVVKTRRGKRARLPCGLGVSARYTQHEQNNCKDQRSDFQSFTAAAKRLDRPKPVPFANAILYARDSRKSICAGAQSYRRRIIWFTPAGVGCIRVLIPAARVEMPRNDCAGRLPGNSFFSATRFSIPLRGQTTSIRGIAFAWRLK